MKISIRITNSKRIVYGATASSYAGWIWNIAYEILKISTLQLNGLMSEYVFLSL